jgi:hypothetical protein
MFFEALVLAGSEKTLAVSARKEICAEERHSVDF